MEIDPRGEIVGYRLSEGIIRSVRRMTYTSVQHCINAGETGETKAAATPFYAANRLLEPSLEDITERERVELGHPGLPAAFDAMLDLALRLNAKRVRRGSIDFDLPNPSWSSTRTAT